MNRTTTIVLVVVLAALALYTVLVQNPRDRAAAEATPTVDAIPRVVWETTADQITSLRVTEPGAGRTVAVAKDAQGMWTVSEPEAGPADANRLLSLTTNAVALSVTSVVTATTDLAPYGVQNPTYTLEVGLADGRTLKAAVGNKAPVGDAYYVLREGDTNVMVVSGFGVDALLELLTTPPYAPTATPAFNLELTPGTPEGTLTIDTTPTP
jgi:hypothetical protein